MAWAKIDDRFFSHPKVRRAGKDAVLLYLASLTYCNEHLTEGFIPAESLPLISISAFVDDFKQSASKLLDVGLWEESSNGLDGFMIHDYLEYNPSKAQVEETKKARAEAGSRGGKATQASKRKQTPSKGEAKPKQNSSNIPSPPLPINSSPKKGEDTQQPYPLALAMAEVCEMNMEANKGRLLREAKTLSKASPTPTPELIKENYGNAGWWYLNDWRGKRNEHPSPATIRETWGQWPNNKPEHREQYNGPVELPDYIGGGQ